jgi:hypothetical protein
MTMKAEAPARVGARNRGEFVSPPRFNREGKQREEVTP